jgi:hypothetical protein
MRTPQLRKNATDDDMGIGWQLRTIGGVRTASHGGTASGGLCLLLELVPERHVAFAILTNHTSGWRLIQEVERSLLASYERLVLAPNQAIAHRGVDETMAHTTPLAAQPAAAEYIGTYARTPLGNITVRAEAGSVLVSGAGGGAGTAILFYAPDRAFMLEGTSPGLPVEFIRDEAGRIGWIRLDGRIGRKQ